MLWTVCAVVVLLWALGLAFHVAGSLIHVLLVIALAMVLFKLLSGRWQSQ
ncbi:MAG: lmo0937 family membrane protein [Terracidiphilus sp.]|nr:lmo0937 family membrane protein [Terracidiphilus sp.]